MRVFALFLFSIVSPVLADENATLTATELAVPGISANATGPALTRSPDGVVWLTWQERERDITTLRFSVFDRGARGWTAPRTIASGRDLYAGQADFPVVTLGAHGRATAVWYVNNPPAAGTAHLHHGSGYRAYFRQSSDGGATWGPATLVSRESDTTEFFSLATLADGRVLATWLDGRAKKSGGTRERLFSRILGQDGRDTLVDESACDCCQTTLTAFPDGSALLAYRGRTDEEIRDIRVTRFRDNAWGESHPLSNDEWKIAGCPVNGPQIASDGGRVAAAWFTGADNDPRVLVTQSPDAGGRFLMPLRISDGPTAGKVATLILHDGAMLVTYVDIQGALWARRITPEFVATPAVPLAAGKSGGIKGFPRLALVRDYDGGPTPAQFLATFVREDSGAVSTLLVNVPENELLEAEKSCDCGPTGEQLKGFPIRGTLLSPQTGGNTVRVKHFEVPGIFTGGEREFKVTPEVYAQANEPGRPFLARVEQRDGAWWLFDLHLIAPAPTH
jgi:hypothetical protein